MCSCLLHSRVNEVVCEVCRSYICPECISVHTIECPNASFTHVLGYASTKVIPKLESIQERVIIHAGKLKEGLAETDLKGFTNDLLKAAEAYDSNVKNLEKLLNDLERVQAQHPESTNFAGLRVRTLEKEKGKFDKAIKGKDIKNLLKSMQQITILDPNNMEAAAAIPPMIKSFKDGLDSLAGNIAVSKAIIADTKTIVEQFGYLGISTYHAKWKLDIKYKTDKISLDPHCLKFACKQGGPVAIIGNTPIKEGRMAYEVVLQGLEKVGKEGFGVVKLSKFKSCWTAANPMTSLTDGFIGCLFKNEVRGVIGVKSTDLEMNKKYYVRIDTGTCSVNITGPETCYSGDLEPGEEYVPCLICESTKSKISIRPLNSFCEGMKRVRRNDKRKDKKMKGKEESKQEAKEEKKNEASK